MRTKDSFIVMNVLILILLCFAAMIEFLMNFWLCMALPALLIATTVLLCKFRKKSAEDIRFRKYVIISRIISIITAAMLILPTVMSIGFNSNKSCYGLKLFVFSCGAENIRQNRTQALPKKLPRNCEDYYFRLSHGLRNDFEINAASAIVKFSTDKDTMAAYEAEFIEKGYKQPFPDFAFEDFLRKKEMKEEEILEYYEHISQAMTDYLCYDKGVPWHVGEELRNKTVDLSHDVIVYDFSEKLGFSSGCLLDYDSGIVIFWA